MTNILSNRYMKVFICFMLFSIAFVATSADANVFSTITDKLVNTFKNVRAVIFIVGGFGLVGLGFAAIFGKIKWTWLAALAAGLAIVALAGAVVDYVTQGSKSEAVNESYSFGDNSGDTLTSGGAGG